MYAFTPPAAESTLTELSLQDYVPGTSYTYEEITPDPERFEDGILAAYGLRALLTHLTPRQRLIVEALYLASDSPDPRDADAVDEAERRIARAHDLAMKTVRQGHQDALDRLRVVWGLFTS